MWSSRCSQVLFKFMICLLPPLCHSNQISIMQNNYTLNAILWIILQNNTIDFLNAYASSCTTYNYKPTNKLEECGYRWENMWRCCTLPLCLRASHEVSSALGIIISTRSKSLGNTYNWILKNRKINVYMNHMNVLTKKKINHMNAIYNWVY